MNAFEILMKNSNRNEIPSKKENPSRKNGSAGWKNVLKPYTEHPEKYSDSVVYSFDDEMVVIYDQYPKAKKHFLILPRNGIESIDALTKEDTAVLLKLRSRGNELIHKLRIEFPEIRNYRLGFHAIPSLQPLHMHVISQDFISPCLKNKTHWNSFTTDFFRDVDVVLEELTCNGEIKYDKSLYESKLKTPLHCHLCDVAPTNMPKLKEHLLEHI
ncbi:HIT-like protein [Basidiobolus meristosporus CBS 931.73]|uniref:HIT-like protein n=1 Tax=Basidiobolus meristosporus CBS 931.73 TaxID=1314790 RepID=A0A1Y1ZDD5_9FUNG|nr:HIT-like protein [Basidiobolus meristosporus CBS 931.73]|eukprot:ORY08300.1 HIT-like protein [Basidiobolus meristosporus CBS 931.73]